MTRKEFVIRIAIHYLIMNGIVLGGGSLFGWFDIHEPLQVAMMALSVAIIFFIISLYSWTKGNREAQKLNQRWNLPQFSFFIFHYITCLSFLLSSL